MSSDLVTAVNSTDCEQTTCAECGTRIDRNEWHPVRAVTSGEDFRIYAFCSDACRKAWSGREE